MNRSECKGCNAEILWGLSPNGKPMPLDVELATLDVANRAHAYVIEGMTKRGPQFRKVTAEDTHGHVSHFRSCVEANRFTRKKPPVDRPGGYLNFHPSFDAEGRGVDRRNPPGSVRYYSRDGVIVAVEKEQEIFYHLTITRDDRMPTLEEITHARYALVPDEAYMAILLAPMREHRKNAARTVHLYETAAAIGEPKDAPAPTLPLIGEPV